MFRLLWKPLKDPGENARSWEALGEARPGQSSLSAGALRYRAWAQSWSSASLASRVFSNTTVQKHQFFSAQPSSQSNSHIHT